MSLGAVSVGTNRAGMTGSVGAERLGAAGSVGTNRAGMTGSVGADRLGAAVSVGTNRAGMTGSGAGTFMGLMRAGEATGGDTGGDLKEVTFTPLGGSGRSSDGPESVGLAAEGMPPVGPCVA